MTSQLFIPTYLYIKQHSVTGKLYFGKTTESNPETYIGSGKHWKHHINKHGKEHVITLWYCLFLDQEYCTEFALNFSIQENIVESDEWLNLKPENGLDGNPSGNTLSDEHKRKISNTMKGRLPNNTGHKHSIETKEKMRLLKLGKPFSIEHLEKLRRIVICPHCNKSGGLSAMHRYHFDNCKSLSH